MCVTVYLSHAHVSLKILRQLATVSLKLLCYQLPSQHLLAIALVMIKVHG